MKGFQEGPKEAFQEAAVLLGRVTIKQEPSVALYLLHPMNLSVTFQKFSNSIDKRAPGSTVLVSRRQAVGCVCDQQGREGNEAQIWSPGSRIPGCMSLFQSVSPWSRGALIHKVSIIMVPVTRDPQEPRERSAQCLVCFWSKKCPLSSLHLMFSTTLQAMSVSLSQAPFPHPENHLSLRSLEP